MYDVLDICKHIIKYSNDKNYGVSNLKLQKLLYFIQVYFIKHKDDKSPCFKDRIEAWDFGPVVPVAYHKYKQYGSLDIPTKSDYDDDFLGFIWNSSNSIKDEDNKMIEFVIDGFSDFSATDLVDITHKQSPWIDAYKRFKNNEITINALREYFDE